jgi:UDP-2-acetamido-3-amino-2,3-dideoxy-glucuronate N-acetyltransferase
MRSPGVTLTKVESLTLTAAEDARGLLTAFQHPGSLPFTPARVFIVTMSPAGTERGGHAHHECHQVLIATAGTVRVEFDDDDGTQVVFLEDATQALHVPPLVWAKQTYITQGASLIVLASHPYDVNDYVDDRVEAALLRERAGAGATVSDPELP